jgi:hypothetical protein
MPAGFGAGTYKLAVIANGIPSATVQFVVGTVPVSVETSLMMTYAAAHTASDKDHSAWTI